MGRSIVAVNSGRPSYWPRTFQRLCEVAGLKKWRAGYARKDSEARYLGLLEAAPDAMVVINQDGGIVLLNVQAEKQFGYQRDELLG
jgi:PAS domain-containing protein